MSTVVAGYQQTPLATVPGHFTHQTQMPLDLSCIAAELAFAHGRMEAEIVEPTIDLRGAVTALNALCALILEVLREKALDLQTDYTEVMLRERRTCQPSERGRIGLRVRTATTSAPGMFQIEWYRVQGKQRTKYLRRGKDKHGRPRMQYSLASFGRMTSWEEALILHYEPQCARLRALLHHIGQLRRDLHPLTVEARALVVLGEPDQDAEVEIEGGRIR